MSGEIQKYTEQLSEALDLKERLTLGESQIYTLRLDNDIVVQYADLNPGLNLMSHLESLPSENKETLLMSLMRLNLFGKGTGGGTLGYDTESHMLTFTKAFPFSLQYDEFKEAVEDFVNYVELWKNELGKLKLGESSLLTL
ncbi:MAG: hypothetical protein S4CHLAM7_04930 [Chlamydiae bacterium]|nr:hypothetical protein [Chlamydiota bacterium]